MNANNNTMNYKAYNGMGVHITAKKFRGWENVVEDHCKTNIKQMRNLLGCG